MRTQGVTEGFYAKKRWLYTFYFSPLFGLLHLLFLLPRMLILFLPPLLLMVAHSLGVSLDAFSDYSTKNMVS